MYLELLKKIYDLLLTGTTLTNESLNSIGLTNEDISTLITNGLIYETKSGAYNITSVNKLFLYGKKNLIEGNKRTAQECFELCYKIKPKHRDTCLHLFYNAILTQNYSAAYAYLNALENVSTNEYLRKDYKIYLFLLSQLSKVPEDYEQKLADINNNPFLILHRKPNKEQQQDNIVMRLVIKGKYKFAIERLNNFLAEDLAYTVHRLIIKSLLSQIIDLNEKYKRTLLEKIKKRRYREILTIIDEISLTRPLKTDESNIQDIVNAIITIFETSEAPIPIDNDATQVSEAIQFYDFKKALDLETEFVVSKCIPSDKSPVYILLLQLNQLIDSVNRLKESDYELNSTDNYELLKQNT